MRRAYYAAMTATNPYRVEGLSSRSATRLRHMLYDLSGNLRKSVTPERVAQIPAEVFNDKKRYTNFSRVSRREILSWLKRNGIETAPIFGRQSPR